MMKFFSIYSGSESVFGAPGGGSFGAVVVTGAGVGGGGGGAAGAGAGFSVIDNSGAAVPARHTISLSKVMNLSCVKRTR